MNPTKGTPLNDDEQQNQTNKEREKLDKFLNLDKETTDYSDKIITELV